MHTWGELKKRVEGAGIRDDDVIDFLENIPVTEEDDFQAERDPDTGHIRIASYPPCDPPDED